MPEQAKQLGLDIVPEIQARVSLVARWFLIQSGLEMEGKLPSSSGRKGYLPQRFHVEADTLLSSCSSRDARIYDVQSSNVWCLLS